jgi:hypothetical protein
VRDFTHPGVMADEQLKHLALIAHHCYRSFDLAFKCLVLLKERQVLETGSPQRYLPHVCPVFCFGFVRRREPAVAGCD